jgi:formylglycine-generating enzyme
VLTLLLAGGCLVPAYEATETASDGSGAGTAGAAGAAAGNVAKAGNGAGSDSGSECGPNQKWCADMCVDVDDVTYGCTPASCNQSACPAGGTIFACEDGACVIGGCDPASKLCDDKCVAVNDPTYGCSESGCDTSACPDPGDGTLICNGYSCEVGSCTGDTKQCGVNCVPPDANHGCADPLDCEPCPANEVCTGTPAACTCVVDKIRDCAGFSCGEVVNSCGATVQCDNLCDADKPKCVDNRCIECEDVSDCDTGGNPCVVAACTAERCVYSPTGSSTSCNRGKCSDTLAGVCVRPAVNAGGVSIDATEVTRGAYAAFVDFKLTDPNPPSAECDWSSDYDPAPELPVWPPPFEDYELPVVGVDWCDAHEYCKWVGRKVCGKIGSGSLEFSDFADATQSQWFHACVGPSAHQFPYGETFDAGKCNGPPDAVGLEPVATFEQCVGAYPGVYDLSGNVAEWTSACDSPTDGTLPWCNVQGGSYDRDVSEGCFATAGAQQWMTTAWIGFRCCGN